MADGNITINAGNVNVTGSSQLIIYSTNGNVTINGGGTYNWSSIPIVLYAPQGTAYPGGGGTQLAYASVVAKQVAMGGGSIYFYNNGRVNWPVGGHVKLVK